MTASRELGGPQWCRPTEVTCDIGTTLEHMDLVHFVRISTFACHSPFSFTQSHRWVWITITTRIGSFVYILQSSSPSPFFCNTQIASLTLPLFDPVAVHSISFYIL